MGGRGASSGMSVKGIPYGEEYSTVYQSGNIKFITSNSGSAKTPMETMTKGRVYATINTQNRVKAITYHDKQNKRFKQIDIIGQIHTINGEPVLPHTHIGYFHDEHGTRELSPKEQKMVERVLKTWYYHTTGK